ncbi:MAG: hypothetical protein JWO82_2605 [Akkermansiaceae bacterium]|nr:hypothetical protein [Akkermansiaceae bacterium]
MKFNHILALVATTLATAAPAGAALVTFSQGDLLMGFHATSGTGAGQTYVVDLGSAASFRDATGNLTLNLGNIGADLTSLYGANWSSRTDLSWGIAGSPSNVDSINGDAAATIYASKAGDATTPPWQITSSNGRTSTSTRLQGVATAFSNGQATINSTVASIQGDTDPNSWRSYMASGGTSGNTPGNLDFGAFSNIEGTPAESLALFRISGAQAGAYEGSFSISSGGIVSFTPVPETSSAVIAGLGAMLVLVRRRRIA